MMKFMPRYTPLNITDDIFEWNSGQEIVQKTFSHEFAVKRPLTTMMK